MSAYLTRHRRAWALADDSFIATGHRGLIEAIQHDIPLNVLIFNNQKARATGGQPVPEGMLDRILKGYEPHVRQTRDPRDARETKTVLQEANRAQEIRIVAADYCRE